MLETDARIVGRDVDDNDDDTRTNRLTKSK